MTLAIGDAQLVVPVDCFRTRRITSQTKGKTILHKVIVEHRWRWINSLACVRTSDLIQVARRFWIAHAPTIPRLTNISRCTYAGGNRSCRLSFTLRLGLYSVKVWQRTFGLSAPRSCPPVRILV